MEIAPTIMNEILTFVHMKDLKSLSTFKNQIKKWIHKDCPCRLCKVYVAQVGFLWKLLRLFASFSGILILLVSFIQFFVFFYFILFISLFILLFYLCYLCIFYFHSYIYLFYKFIYLFIYLFLVKSITRITAKR